MITGATILCIAGGVGDIISTPFTKLKVGVLVYVASFAAVTIMYAITTSQRRYLPKSESRIFLAIGIALPLILVRLAYSITSVFGHDRNFSPVGGSVGVRVGISIVEEFLVVLVYVVLGYTLQAIESGHQQ